MAGEIISDRHSLAAVQGLVGTDPELWFNTYGKIRDKEARIVTPTSNILQERVFSAYRQCQLEKKPCLIQILKPRQKGASTGAEALIYHHNRRYDGLNGVLMGDVESTSDKVFEMYRLYGDEDSYRWKDGSGWKVNKVDYLEMPNGSRYSKETAGSRNAGRSGTVQVLHSDETAFYPKSESRDPALALFNSLYSESERSLAFITSTPNGASGTFYNYWNDEDNGWIKIFAAWFEFWDSVMPFRNAEEREAFELSLRDDELEEQSLYPQITLENLKWRRHTIGVKCEGDVNRFKQEYPSDAETCLVGETLVLTDYGMLPIKGIRVGTPTPNGPVLAHQCMGTKETVILTTARGIRIECTPDHRVELGEGGFSQAQDCVGRTVKLFQPKFAPDGEYHTVCWPGFGCQRHSLTITEDWGRFLGYFMGDGDFYGNTVGICLDGRDTDIEEDYRALFGRLFGLALSSKATGSKRGGLYLRSSNVQFKALFNELGLIEEVRDYNRSNMTHRRRVHVPRCIWISPKAVITEFLRALFDCDGWIKANGNMVKLFSKHENFMRDIQLLLMGYGIHAKLVSVVKALNGNSYPGMELVLNPYESRKFCQQIGFLSERKRSRMNTEDYVRPANGRCADTFDFTDRVASVVPGESREVYDIQIGGRPVFGANGISVHNCFLASSRMKFSARALVTMSARAKQDHERVVQRGNMVVQDHDAGVNLIPDPTGEVEIFEEPKFGLKYLISVDVCTGEDQQSASKTADPDYHDVQVWRAGYLDIYDPEKMILPKVVGYHYSRIDIDLLAEVVVGMWLYYGQCLVIPEVNNCGLALVKLLQQRNVNMFRRKPKSDPNAHEKDEQSRLGQYGWNTTSALRKYIIDQMVPTVRNEECDLSHPRILGQFQKFIVNKNGKPEAMPGHHDDAVMSACIGHYNLKLATEYKPPRPKRVNLRRLASDPRYKTPRGWQRVV
ncbi:hypothetical protein H5P28_11795 [Ruficoccus amylovorans]|uniref:DOD-type homing endonuclease domain-containing protein n=1 Tax=Ruficoccus amylovorans TaxID=1804625 RepID=A0A842HFE3_9BACT|nr:LAGLIDADG family homing endonuclease [Ruficoccus amylovorans]MBC2594940.1 hypothetical protein [Ruficoccus amylovorans]